MSMPFPTGTWNFEVVSKNPNTPNNSLTAEWGTMTFATVNGVSQVTLTIGGVSAAQTVIWESTSDNVGSIGATTFLLGTTEYSFQRITITNLTINGQTVQVAHVADATLTVSGSGHRVFFTGLPSASTFLNPKVANYADTSTPSLFSITVNSDDSITVTPSAGWTLSGSVVWNRPSTTWPPLIQFTLQSTSTPTTTNAYTGVVTAKFERASQQVSYQFGGTVTTSGAAPGSDIDWTSTAEVIPIPKAATRYA